MLKKVFLLYLLFSNVFLLSQEHKEINVHLRSAITRNSLHQDTGNRIFELISNVNQSNPDSIRIDVAFNLSINIESNSNDKHELMLTTNIINVEPNFDLMAFNVDTIILPSLIHFNLIFSQESGQADTLSMACSPYGDQYFLNNYSNVNSNFSVEVADVTFNYDDGDFMRLEMFIKAIKNYYSYGNFLDYVNKKYFDINIKKALSSQDIFIYNIELDRIAHNLNSAKDIYLLNIKENDPINFSDKLEAFNRYHKRYETLFLNLLLTPDSNDVEPDIFCYEFADIPNDYLLMAESLQPQEAYAFINNASLYNDFDSEFMLEAIVGYYGKKNGINSDYIYNLITDRFIDKAYYWRNMENYNNSLLLLKNAFVISDQSGIPPPKTYYSLKVEITEGLALSFIRVGNMALSNGNIDFGERYISKSNKLLYDGLQSFYVLDVFNENLAEIIDIQNNTIGIYCQFELFENAIELNRLSALICMDRTYDYCLKVDSVKCMLESDIFNVMLMDLSLLIDNNDYLEAFTSLSFIGDSIDSYVCDDNEIIESYNRLSDSLYIILISQGKKLMSAKNPTLALEYLLNAKQISEKNGDDTNEINKLIKFAAEPVIIGYITKAKYDTWKNNIDSANHNLDLANTLSYRYFYNGNDRINIAIDKLQEQMMSRNCIDIGNGYNDAIRKAKIHIRNKKFDDLPILTAQALAYLQQNNDCKLDSSILFNFISKYKHIINYQNIYNDVIVELLDKDYMLTIENYKELEKYYSAHEIELTDLNHNDLMLFVKNQNLYQLTIEAMLFSINNNDLDDAVYYLRLAYHQGAIMKDIKPSVMELAKLLAIRDNLVNVPVNETLQIYTDDIMKINYFKIIYVKNRVVKPTE